jgi:hypothetical protein
MFWQRKQKKLPNDRAIVRIGELLRIKIVDDLPAIDGVACEAICCGVSRRVKRRASSPGIRIEYRSARPSRASAFGEYLYHRQGVLLCETSKLSILRFQRQGLVVIVFCGLPAADKISVHVVSLHSDRPLTSL